MLWIFAFALIFLTFSVFLVVPKFRQKGRRICSSCHNVIPGRNEFCPYCGKGQRWPLGASCVLAVGISLAIIVVVALVVTVLVNR